MEKKFENQNDSFKNVMCDIFRSIQEEKTDHQKFLQSLQNLYEQTNFDDFYNYFIMCMNITLNYPELNMQVENTLEFAAKFASKLAPLPAPVSNRKIAGKKKNENQFLNKIFEFIFENHAADKPQIRFRICFFLNLLLRSMKKNLSMNFEFHEKIVQSMSLRSMDDYSSVRLQAVLALYSIQDHFVSEASVMELYSHLSKNDQSAAIRRTIITHMKKNRKSLVIVLERIRDIDESVRKEAYLFLCKISMKSLTIINRQNILKYGLQDSESIRKIVSQKILPAWLSTMNDNLLDFLDYISSKNDVESRELALNALFNRMDLNILLKQLPLDPETKLIPSDELTLDKSLYWKCFVQHLHRLSYTHVLDCIIPDLTNFCTYIREIISSNASEEQEQSEKLSHKYKIFQLFEIAKMYGLSDSVGSFHLKQLIGETLKSEICYEKLMESIIMYYEKVVPDITERINMLTHIIKDIKWTGQSCKEVHKEKIDTKSMTKCLGIMCAMLQSASIKSIIPSIRTLLVDLALPNIDNPNPDIQILSLKAVGICLLLDRDLAKLHLKKYLTILATPKIDCDVKVMTLTVIFDLLLTFGLNHFNFIHQEDDFGDDDVDEESCETTSESSNKKIIHMMMKLMDNKDEKIRTSAAIGFCKLLLHGRISSVQSVSRLIILRHDPATQRNGPLRRVLICFFEQYPIETSGSRRVLEKVFIPTLRSLFTTSHSRKIPPKSVARFILRLTSDEFAKYEERDHTIHNILALNILDEILDIDDEYGRDILINSLEDVQVQIGNEKMKTVILTKVKLLVEELQLNDELLKCLLQFKTRVHGCTSVPASPA